MKKPMLALTAALLLNVAGTVYAQSGTGSLNDDVQTMLAQIQSDKRAVMLKSLELTDAETRAFTPIYDEYQGERKKVAERKVNVLNKFAANYGSMTDDAAKGILKDWFKTQEDDTALVKKYAKKLERALPATKVLRFVQVENKLDTVLNLEAVRVVPLAK
jgi:hypothetical protein